MFTQATSGFASGTGEKVSVGKSSGSSYSQNKSFGFTKPPVKSGAVFNVGDCVQHKVFGKGMVMKPRKWAMILCLKLPLTSRHKNSYGELLQ
mgnify:CR=1 FL=1